MADTTTTNYGWTKPEVGASDDTWGAKGNANLDAQDASLKAVSDVANAALPKSGGTMTGELNASTTFVHAKQTYTSPRNSRGSIADNTNITVATIPTGETWPGGISGSGQWICSVYSNSGASTAFVVVGDTNLISGSIGSSNFTWSISGQNIQVKQTTGGPLALSTYYTVI